MTTFSEDRRYRYTLKRLVNENGDGAVTFVMLNPSTADEHKDDPTIRRCRRFARDWGAAKLLVVNLSPLRATNPRDLERAGPEPEPVRLCNLREIERAAEKASRIVLAWGVHGDWEGRDCAALRTLGPWAGKLHLLGLTRGGHPRHPLPVRADQEPIPIRWIACVLRGNVPGA